MIQIKNPPPRSRGRRPAGPVVLMSHSDTAAYLGVHRETLRNWRSAGQGPDYVTLPGGHIRYPLTAVEAWVAARTTRTAQP
jgi:excisionase family DNA binding protein